ncbi:STY4528 family pathogenicity island replication protein [Pseudomonas farris]
MNRKGPASLSSLLDNALERLQPHDKQPNGDGFLFSGNRHETVPRALLLDIRLTPLERNAWQVFRLMLSDDGVTAFPTYDQLRRYLASVPCGALASHETVAKTLTMLRLTRWLSLVRRRRDTSTGRMLGNLYVLHDAPLSPFEALQLDPEYMGLVSQTLEHANKGIQRVGLAVLEEISQDPNFQMQLLPSQLQVLTQRLLEQQVASDEHMCKSEEPASSSLRNEKKPTSESESGHKSTKPDCLRNPKTASTLSTKTLKEIRTEPHAREISELTFPAQFSSLKPAQQAGAKVALLQLNNELRQAVLNEWAARCRDTQVRNPAGYLFGIIQKALHGQFTSWASKTDTTESTSCRHPPKREKIAECDPKIAHTCLAELKGLLRIR